MALTPTFAGKAAPWLSNNSDSLLQLSAGLLGGRTAQDQIAGGLGGFATAQQQTKQRNKTLEFLRTQNPDLAAAVESGALTGGDAYKLYYQQKLEAQKPRNNLLPVGKNLYNFQNGEWISPPAGLASADEEWGLTPVWGESDGKTVLGQVSKAGKFKPLDTGNFNPTPVIQNLDTGTAIIGRNSRTGAEVTNTPKNIADKAALEEIGAAQGKAIAAAPGDLQAGQNAIDTIESLRNDPYKSRGTGFSSLGNVIPGTGGYDFSNKVDQAKSGAFLTAIQQMRGLGSLSNAEGGAATAAVNRMNTATSEEEFNAALNDYEKIVRQGMARAQARIPGSGGGLLPQAPAAAPGATSSGVKWSIEQ
jgi:hypothetical protein